MIEMRQANDRGHFKNHWLDSHHSFSFGEYYDPRFMGLSVLRVINDDNVIPGAGFPTHPHRDMEIISYVLEGELAHKDSMGNGSVIKPGDVQRMSAGTGVTHSEFNPSDDNGTNFLQIWLLPNQQGVEPGYQQKYFAPESRQGQLTLLLSADGRDGSIHASTDALMYGSLLDANERVVHQLAEDRVAYIHLAKGSATLNGKPMEGGDGASVIDESEIELIGLDNAEVLLFDLPR